MTHHEIIVAIYHHFIELLKDNMISITLRIPSVVGTVQDDPFDSWVGSQLKKALPSLEVIHSGKLTTPDILIRDKKSGAIVGLEVKKLIQKPNGADPRGLTLDYNSSIPCGQALIKVGNDTVAIPCFYIFCLLDPTSSHIITMILMDGDFLNYDFDLYKQAKVANVSEYNHGPYGEGSVRHRAMYTYPNPLNSKLSFFHLRKILVIKKFDAKVMKITDRTTHIIRRDDIYGNSFHYSIIDFSIPSIASLPSLLTDIFKKCKERKPRRRTIATARLEPEQEIKDD